MKNEKMKLNVESLNGGTVESGKAKKAEVEDAKIPHDLNPSDEPRSRRRQSAQTSLPVKSAPTDVGGYGGEGDSTEESEFEYDTVDPINAARKGKIAALSRNVRESLNRRMRRGEPGPDLLEWLNAEPAVVELLGKQFEGKPITRKNLWEWRHGGYKEWARHRAACQRLKRKQVGKGANRHELGEEMAQLYAEELTETLDELVASALEPEVRMQRLEKGLNQIRGWRRSDYHAQRMALDKEKLQWRSQCHAQELRFKEKKLQLEREKFERHHVEEIINTCNNPKIRKAAQKDEPDYGALVSQLNTLLFGDEEEEDDVQALNGGTVESEMGANIEQPTSDIEHPVEDGEAPTSKLQAPEKHQASNPNSGDESFPEPVDAKDLQNEGKDAVKQPVASPSVTPGYGQNEPTDVESEKGTNIQHSVEGAKEGQGDKGNLALALNLHSIEVTMSAAQADKIVSEWKALAKSFGGNIINHSDVAELSAYLSGQPRPWYSLKIGDLEMMSPPSRDPRFNPESPWCKAWQDLERYWAAQPNSNEKN